MAFVSRFIHPLRVNRVHGRNATLSCVAQPPTKVAVAAVPPTDAEAAAIPLLRHGRALVRAAISHLVQTSGVNVAIDATCGRGSDTLTLAEALGSDGVVHAFDVQAAAIEETRARHSALVNTARLVTHCTSHADLRVFGVEQVAAVVYNLGWYPAPGADRALITLPESTLSSLNSAAQLTAPGGGIVITAYRGHPGGLEESDAVMQWVAQLSPRTWACTFVDYPNRNNAPCVHVCERIR